MPKISALTSLAQADVVTTTDVLPIVDATAPATTKKVTVQAMVNAGLATLTTLPSGIVNASLTSVGTLTALTVSGLASVTANSASAALTVTQTGAGNAFVVEDSASPDSTPFAINAAGEVGVQVPAKAGTQVRLPTGADVRVAVSTDTPHLAGSSTDLFFGVIDGGGLCGVHVLNTHDGTYSSQSISFKTAKGGVVSATERLSIGTLGEVAMNANSTSAALTVTQTGSGNALVVEDSASDTTPFVISGDGQVRIGYPADIDGYALQVATTTGTAASFFRYNAASTGPVMRINKSRSASIGSYAIVSAADTLGTIRFFGDDGSAYVGAADIKAEVDGTPGTNDMPGRLVFSTTADGASSPTERLRIDSAGLITARNSTGLGYGAGSGGTVTQATSKSTAVTLNKPSGQITTAADALAAGASAEFIVNNSSVASTDTVMLLASGNGDYRVEPYTVFNGSFYVRVTNITGGSLSQAVVINYNVIKGSAT